MKAHSGNRWNDRADELASIGETGRYCDSGRFRRPEIITDLSTSAINGQERDGRVFNNDNCVTTESSSSQSLLDLNNKDSSIMGFPINPNSAMSSGSVVVDVDDNSTYNENTDKKRLSCEGGTVQYNDVTTSSSSAEHSASKKSRF